LRYKHMADRRMRPIFGLACGASPV
jgi:hypothetical protein